MDDTLFRDRQAGRACERALVLAILLALFAALSCAGVGGANADRAALRTVSHAATTPVVEAVEAVGITVSDLDRSVAFYTTVLGFERAADRETRCADNDPLGSRDRDVARRTRLRLGDETLELTQYARPGRSAPADSRSTDAWFQHVAIIVSDMRRAYERLRARHVVAATIGGPQRIPDSNPQAAGIEAYYFKDPDGHPLEILHFPPDKGAAKWHRDTRALFLGIDHTAIVVGDTERSLGFYRDVLGMHVTGRSLNRGVEQEHLSGVPGAQVRITSLHAEDGPGIELLEYLAPRGGRPMPADEEPSDVFHWETHLRLSDASAAAGRLRNTAAYPTIPSASDRDDVRVARPIVARDPNGHVINLEHRCR